MDDYLTRFRNKTEIEQATSAKISDIIAKSLSRIEVTLERLSKAIPVIFINNDKEAANESIMYSYTSDAVMVSDYVTASDGSHLVYKEIKNIKREDYIDCWKTILCNTTFNFNTSDIKAYFRGSLRSVQSEEENLAEDFGVTSSGEAFIIIPASVGLTTNTQIKIGNKGWRTTFRDDITNPGIAYIAIEEYNIVDLEKLSENETALPIPPIPSILPELIAGITNSFITEGGYIKADKPINIISRTAALVTFTIPFETGDITIEVRENGIEVATHYLVRG